MRIGNADDVEVAVLSGDADEIREAWFFYERVESLRAEKSTIFLRQLAAKKLKVLEAALRICPENGSLNFFGSKEKIEREIELYRKESAHD